MPPAGTRTGERGATLQQTTVRAGSTYESWITSATPTSRKRSADPQLPAGRLRAARSLLSPFAGFPATLASVNPGESYGTGQEYHRANDACCGSSRFQHESCLSGGGEELNATIKCSIAPGTLCARFGFGRHELEGPVEHAAVRTGSW
jgi:hypothetical protein